MAIKTTKEQYALARSPLLALSLALSPSCCNKMVKGTKAHVQRPDQRLCVQLEPCVNSQTAG